MLVSVALCTFNGARYLVQQLESYTRQTRIPDELIVVDDGSTDGTLGIVEDFATRAPFRVSVHRNEANLGVTANFAKAISLASGDLIFPSDQDDVWHPDKLERMEKLFASDAKLDVVVCNATLIDGENRPFGRDFWSSLRFDDQEIQAFDEGRGFEVLVNKNLAAGMALGMRASFLAQVLPIPGCWIHDGWIALLAAAVDSLAIIRAPLVDYRIHGSNTIGLTAVSFRERLYRAVSLRHDMLQLQAQQMDNAAERLAGRASPARLRFLADRSVHYRARITLPASRLSRWPMVRTEFRSGRYHRYSMGFLTAVKDLLR